MTEKSDPADLFVQWYNCYGPHMSPDWDGQETHARAFARKMPEEWQAVADGKTGEGYRADAGWAIFRIPRLFFQAHSCRSRAQKPRPQRGSHGRHRPLISSPRVLAHAGMDS